MGLGAGGLSPLLHLSHHPSRVGLLTSSISLYPTLNLFSGQGNGFLTFTSPLCLESPHITGVYYNG